MIEKLIERLIKETKDWDYSLLERTFWAKLIKNEQDAVDIHFDLENDYNVGKQQEVELGLVHRNKEHIKILAQLYSAGGDWENQIAYFRCQYLGLPKMFFIHIPDSKINKNLIKSDKGGYIASQEGDFVKIKDMEQSLWKSLKDDLNKRLQPIRDDRDVDFKSIRLYSLFP